MLTKSYQVNGIQIKILIKENKLKINLEKFLKLMMFFPTRIEDHTTMISVTDNTVIRTQTELLKDFMNNMVWKMKTKRNSLINIIQIEEETTIRFLEFLNMLAKTKLKKLTENLLCNIILKIMETMQKQEENSMKSMKHTMLFQINQKDITMI